MPDRTSPRAADPASRAWVGVAAALGSAIAFSWKAILAKLAYRTGVDATTVVGMRMLFALPAYLGLARAGARRRPLTLTRRDLGSVASLGLLGYYVGSYLDFLGLTRISAGLERLILFLHPSIVVVLAAYVRRRRVSGREWQAMALGYLGVASVVAGDLGSSPHSGEQWFGASCVFASSIAYASYLVFAEPFVIRLGSMRFTGLAMSCACVFSLLPLAVTAWGSPPPPAEAIWFCFLMAVFATVIPTLLLNEAVRRIGPGRAALCGMVGPVATVGLEVTLLGEAAHWTDALGTALVISSVALLTRPAPARAPLERGSEPAGSG